MPPLAPRPFSQLARRDHRLYGNTLPGLRGTLSAAPWYRRAGRRAEPRAQHCEAWRKRRSRAYWHRTELVQYWGEVG